MITRKIRSAKILLLQTQFNSDKQSKMLNFSSHKLFKYTALISVSSIVTLGYSNLATAKPVVYDFTVNVVEGSLKGSTYKGVFSYDDEKLADESPTTQTQTINAQQGLKVCMDFFNQIHDESKDVNYPEYPILTLKEGKPETLDFWMESREREIWWNRNGWNVEISPRENATLITECEYPVSNSEQKN